MVQICPKFVRNLCVLGNLCVFVRFCAIGKNAQIFPIFSDAFVLDFGGVLLVSYEVFCAFMEFRFRIECVFVRKCPRFQRFRPVLE